MRPPYKRLNVLDLFCVLFVYFAYILYTITNILFYSNLALFIMICLALSVFTYWYDFALFGLHSLLVYLGYYCIYIGLTCMQPLPLIIMGILLLLQAIRITRLSNKLYKLFLENKKDATIVHNSLDVLYLKLFLEHDLKEYAKYYTKLVEESLNADFKRMLNNQLENEITEEK